MIGKPAETNEPKKEVTLREWRKKEMTPEQSAKFFKTMMIIIGVFGFGHTALNMIVDYMDTQEYRAQGAKYDSSTGNYVAADKWKQATPDEDLDDIDHDILGYDPVFGKRCMIKESRAEAVKKILACFEAETGRKAPITSCTRSNKNQKRIRKEFEALTAKDGKPRPVAGDTSGPHVVRGDSFDIGGGPGGADFDIIRKCAERHGYRGGFCGIRHDPFHYQPHKYYKGGKKKCNIAIYGLIKAEWKIKGWRAKIFK